MNKFFAKIAGDLKNPKVICSIVCSVLMLAIFVLMFVPFWSYEGMNEETFEPENRIVSINGYLWFPSDHDGVEDVFNAPVDGVPVETQTDANTIALPIGMQILFAGFGIVLCIWKAKSSAVALLPIACGAFGIYGYIFVDALRLGVTGVWVASLVLSILALVLGIVRIILGQKYKDTIASLRNA